MNRVESQHSLTVVGNGLWVAAGCLFGSHGAAAHLADSGKRGVRLGIMLLADCPLLP